MNNLVLKVFFLCFCLIQITTSSVAVPYLPQTPKALLITGTGNLITSDLVVKNRLESLGFTVSVVTGPASKTADADDKQLIVISSTINSWDVGAKFTNVSVPVINWEHGLFKDLKMTAATAGNFGNFSGQNSITITDYTHPLAAGLSSGVVQVYSSNEWMVWGNANGNATVIATRTGQPQQPVLFAYETGAGMFGITAPARRVGIFLYNNSASVLTNEGLLLLDAAIQWAAGTIAQNQPPQVNILSPANGSVVTIGNSFQFQADASDTDGSVERVEFFINGVLSTTIFNPPFSFAVYPSTPGSYQLTATAYDNLGASASHSVNITVEDTPQIPSDFSITFTAPSQNAVFTAPANIQFNVQIENENQSEGATFLSVINNASSWRKLKLGYNPTNIWGPNQNVIAGGNHQLEITVKDNSGTAQWDRIMFRPQGKTNSPANLQQYVNTAGGVGSDWVTLQIPLSDFPGFDFTNVSYMEFPGCLGAAAFEIGIQKIEFTGGTNPFVWLGDDKTDNSHDGNGNTGQLLAEWITATDEPAAITKVEYYSGNNLIGISTTPPFSYQWNPVTAGNYSVTAIAFDATGATASATTSFTVIGGAVNMPPTVSITSPASGATFIAPATIPILTNAADPDGNIVKVEFYSGTQFIGMKVSANQIFNWTNVSAGNYVLTAKAFDNNGAVTTSAPVNVVVENTTSTPSPLSVVFTSPGNNSVFIEPGAMTLAVKVLDESKTPAPPVLSVINDASSWRKLKLGYHPVNIWGPNQNVITGGNNVLELTIRDVSGTAQWNNIQFRPQGNGNSPASLQSYVNAVGGVGSDWVTLQIPLSHFPGFDFTKVTYMEFPGCIGALPFEIEIQKIEFTGGTAPFLWFGDIKTDNAHDGKGNSGQLTAQLLTFTNEADGVTKVDFFANSNLIGSTTYHPYAFQWNNVSLGNYALTARAQVAGQAITSALLPVSVEKAIGDTLKIRVTFNSAPSTLNVTKAPLKYNKDFAYSYTTDDCDADGYTTIYPFFSGGLNEHDNQIYPGMFYTDGCGNDVPFKAGLAWYTVNSLGNDLHVNRSVNNKLTWAELIELHDAGWDVLNHSYSHAANNTNVKYNDEILKNIRHVDSLTGIQMTHFVIPSGDLNYTQPALNNGMLSVYNQAGAGYQENIIPVNNPVNLNDLKMKRRFLQNIATTYSNITSHIDQVAALSVNGNHYWYNDATHSVTHTYNGSLVFPLFKYYMEYVANTHGKNGSDRMWMAPLQEVYEYLAVKQATQIESSLNGNVLEINLLLHDVPQQQRRYALSLVLNANTNIQSVEVEGTNNYCYSENGNSKLINLDWTANHPDKTFKTEPKVSQQEIQTTISEEEKIELFPNPVNNKLYIKFTGHESAEVQIVIYNITGKKFLHQNNQLQTGTTQLTIDVSKLPQGIYIMEALSEFRKSGMMKFVKQ